jgi:hypothetical protein
VDESSVAALSEEVCRMPEARDNSNNV